MAEPSQTSFVVRFGNAVLALLPAILFLMMFHPHWQRPDAVPGILILLLLWMVFYRLVAWICVDRPEQIKKRVPITSKEVREDRKAFYDWLASQGSLPERRRKGKHSS